MLSGLSGSQPVGVGWIDANCYKMNIVAYKMDTEPTKKGEISIFKGAQIMEQQTRLLEQISQERRGGDEAKVL